MPQENIGLAESVYATLDRGDLDAFRPDPSRSRVGSLIAEAEGQTYRGHDGARGEIP